MQIMIEKVEKNNVIHFTSKYGNAKALWQCDNPECKTYNVEIDIEGCLIWGLDIKKTSNNRSISINENGKIIIVGKFESIDEDGYIVLRIGNSIIMFFTEGKAFNIGEMIEVGVESLNMTPY